MQQRLYIRDFDSLTRNTNVVGGIMTFNSYQLTEDNYKQYINDIRKYYTTYDYDGIFDDKSTK